MEEVMKIGVSKKFNLERAVCNHGFFMMAPNKWIPSEKCLMRPLSLSTRSHLTLSITQPPNQHHIIIKLLSHHNKLPLSTQHKQSIRCQVRRMLRISSLDEMMVEEFHKIHPLAKQSHFGRIFCSPTLFEDIVKSLLLCFCGWARSLEMAEALCNLEEKLYGIKKKKRRRDGKEVGDISLSNIFPSPKDIVACLDEERLNKLCNLGFRAAIILELARNIENGSLNLDDFETPNSTSSTYDLATSHHNLLWNRLIRIKGFGTFTVANVMMCIGFYQYIPIDSETIKHLHQVHGMKLDPKKKKSETKREVHNILSQIYDQYAPFQCLAYWMERVEYYEKYLGKLSDLPYSKYCNVTSINLISSSSL